MQAEVDARRSGGEMVGATRSDAEGRYALSLAAGSYTLSVVVPNGQPRCPPTDVVVRAGQVTRADIACDTGIR
ncbi:MAG: carboxypeptidase-like regulatory domain-containing protein [Acidimicrobiales bacterium]